MAMCASCTYVSPPPPRVSVAPSAAARPSAIVRPSPPPSLFDFRRGTLEDAFRAYAVSYWGPNGTSAVAWKGGVAEIGQYAAVRAPEGFWVRDFGHEGWVTEIERARDRVVVKYRVSDGDAARDWRAWRGRIPEITSVTHMVVEVWALDGRDAPPRVVFAHEYEAWASCCGSEMGPAPPRISDDVAVTATEVHLRARDAWRATRASWHETPLPGIDPVLAPWDSPREVVFTLTR